ncbi:MAG: hypothetical protein A2Y33_02255 [Spirochaetes bacterium GWF1_51_8]|nr:MAG: hypothetical protein A2Y33_02255 [Spirochaetes bacterium GWF1_51_8]
MGTFVEQKVFGRQARRAAREAAGEVARLERLWSVFRPDSEIARLRRHAGHRAIRLHRDTIEILRLSGRMFALTEGAFDISIAPLVRLWRDAESKGYPPPDNEIAAMSSLQLGQFDVSADGKFMLPIAGMELDLGGIAKGYAADRSRDIYRKHGAASAMINLGGNVLVIGCKPDGTSWNIGLNHPLRGDNSIFGWIEAGDCSVVTSGGYRRFFEVGGEYLPHIVDPRSGIPVAADIASATIVSQCSAEADALATAVFVLGAEKGMELIGGISSAEAVIFDTDGKIRVTPGLSGRFHKSTDD